MIERVSLLKALKTPGYEAAVMTTFSCYLPFLEEVVIRRLGAVGCRHNLVLADRKQLSKAIESNPPNQSGIDYWLLPIDSRSAFHPKLILLVGKDKGLLFVGSHNITYSGFGGNREVTNVLAFNKRSSTEHLAVLQRALATLRSWAHRSGVPDVDTAFEQILDLAPWLKETPPDTRASTQLLVGGPENPALLDQLLGFIQTPIRDIVVSGAFFDGESALLQQLQDSLRPQRFYVAVQSRTVELPPSARSLSGVEFVDAEALGPDASDYLHAKLLYLVSEAGDSVFASGSANPSRPAWLASGKGANDEAMLVRLESDATEAASALGVDVPTIKGLDPLTEGQWESVSANWSASQVKSAEETTAPPLRIAVSPEPGTILLETPNASSDTNFQFLGPNDAILPVLFETEHNETQTRLTVDPDLEVPLVREQLNGATVAYHLVHYRASLEEHSRTGAQKKFRTSLASLDADSPELSTLFRCFEQVILDPESYAKKKARVPASRTADDEPDAPPTFEVDIASLSTTTRRRRLSEGTDLGYILDLLIRSLHQATTDSYGGTDALGRDEEEQIGADDDSEDEAVADQRSEEQRTKILSLCHKKVASLARRTKSELERVAREKLPIEDVILKLTAILALLRHLKAHDTVLWWVNPQQGETSVPRDSLEILRQAVLAFLETNGSLLAEADQESMTDFEEVGRLKGLVFWLAIETGVHLRLNAQFNESAEQTRERVEMNTEFIALGDMMANDALAIEEATETIRVTNSAGMANLQRAIQVHRILQDCRNSPTSISTLEPGDLAYHPTVSRLGIRGILSHDGSQTQLARLGGGNARIYKSENLRYLSAGELQNRLRNEIPSDERQSLAETS